MNWIELLFGLDPDHANGSIDWGLSHCRIGGEIPMHERFAVAVIGAGK
jgi:hypothetical protein